MRKIKRLASSLPMNIIGAIVALLVIFGLLVSILGFVSFSNAMKKEYEVTTYHMADTASAVVNGDHLEEYLTGGERKEYLRTKQTLDIFCKRINVSLIYVILVDPSDYGRFVSVFNSVNNAVDNSEYVEWEPGHRRDATNDEYRQKYREIYENGSPYETIYRYRTTDGSHPHITTMTPVKNSSGEVAGILCVQRPIRELIDARRPYTITIAVTTLLLSAVSAWLAAVYLKRMVIQPIRKASREAVRFAKENTRGEKLEGISRYEDLNNLAQSIDTMENDMVSYIDHLTRVTAEKERIGTELLLARTIQANSIPNVFPAFPDRKEFDMFASMKPAREVGGDFYNFQMIDDDHLALVIGDVSGKGIPGCLFMMVTNILVQERTGMGGTPAEILTFVNERICSHNRAEMFVTVWLGILEISTGKLTAANAGHEYPLLKRADGPFEIFRDKHGFVIGGLNETKYTSYEIQMNPGDRLFVYTDGIPEATDADNTLFGTERMLKALNEAGEGTPEQILNHADQAVLAFVKEAEQFDDQTMMCLEYKGRAAQIQEK